MVRAGPDQFPRKNVVRARLLHALASARKDPVFDTLTGKLVLGPNGKPVMVLVDDAMVQEIVVRY